MTLNIINTYIINTDIKINYNELDDNVSDVVYQKQFLLFFNLDTYDANIIEMKTNLLYENLKNHPEIIKIIQLLNKKSMDNISLYLLLVNSSKSQIDSNIFSILFSFEYFYLFYKCYCNYTNNIENPFNDLINYIN